MRIVAGLAVAIIVACGPPPPARDVVSPDALEHQDPKADTSKNPSHEVSGGSWFSRLHLWPASDSNPFATTSSPPHYYAGCGGCSTDDDAGGLLVWIGMLAALSQRPRRPRVSSR